MIILIVIAAIALITTAFAVMPPLPATPPYLLSFNEQLADILQNGVLFLQYLFTPILLTTTIVVIIAIFAAEPIYHSIMWILRKIPMVGIK